MRDRTRSFWQAHPLWSALLGAILVIAVFLGVTKLVIPAVAHALDDRPTPSAEALQAITVTTPTQTCDAWKNQLTQTVPLRVESMEPVGKRIWSDSVALPIDGANQDLAFGQVLNTICSDPHYGLTVGAALARLDIGNTSLLSRNDWLGQFTFDKVPATAASYMPTLNVTSPTSDQINNAVKRNTDWQKTAGYINTLLVQLQRLGFHALPSTWNVHLTGFERSVGLPTVGLNDKQENLPALVLGWTEKGQQCPLFTIAFNTGDKRPEGVDICAGAPQQTISTPVVPAPPTATPPPVVECPNGCAPPPVVECPNGCQPPQCTWCGCPGVDCTPHNPCIDNPSLPGCQPCTECCNGDCPPPNVPKSPNPSDYPHLPEAPPAVADPLPSAPVVPQAPATRTPQAPVHESTGPNGATAPGANPAPAPGVNPSAPPISQAPRGTGNGGPGAGTHSADPDS